MRFIYSVLIRIIGAFLHLTTLFSSKMKLFVNGRKDVWKALKPLQGQLVVWFHCDSLGEYEQGLPVMEEFKKEYPHYKLLVTFFSPSGYENKKNNTIADVTAYLPMDTLRNVRLFLRIVNPSLVVFV